MTTNNQLAKTDSYNELESKILELEKKLVEKEKEINKLTTRGLRVYEENQKLTANPEIAARMAEMDYQLSMAEKFIKSGAFPKMTAEQAYTTIKAGQEMGMSEVQSLNSLYCVNGSINLYGKAMVSKLTSNGYMVDYKDETPDKVTVVVTTPDGRILEETATTDDQIIQKSQAAKISMKNKLRYHGVRMILNFRLPHLIEGASDMFNQFVQHEEVSSTTHPVVAAEKKEYKRIEEHIKSAVEEKDIDALQMVEPHLHTPELQTLFDEAKKEIEG